KIIEYMLRNNITSYYKVFDLIKTFYLKGPNAIPMYG
ncbi:MAG: hypothetical protein AMDU1_APLC00015G0001, partial [Thermoplasmatales archaeon A-plasma]